LFPEQRIHFCEPNCLCFLNADGIVISIFFLCSLEEFFTLLSKSSLLPLECLAPPTGSFLICFLSQLQEEAFSDFGLLPLSFPFPGFSSPFPLVLRDRSGLFM